MQEEGSGTVTGEQRAKPSGDMLFPVSGPRHRGKGSGGARGRSESSGSREGLRGGGREAEQGMQ